MISEQEFTRLHRQEWERLKQWPASDFRRAVDSLLSVVCSYFTDFETDERQVVDAFGDYIAGTAGSEVRPVGDFEQFAAGHLAQLAHRHASVVRTVRATRRAEDDEKYGWRIGNEVSWRFGGEVGARGDWRADKLFVHAAIADRTLTPYLGLSRIRGAARSGAIRIPDDEREFLDATARWLTSWEVEPERRPELETRAQRDAVAAAGRLMREATALHELSDLDEELDKLPPTRWV
ncbi:hypothetical protein IRT45_15450 [Nocardia sp. BSTN01]|uniref:hypothetical protein n=1 Tax=Nocardia sp. BSTN01 TaxID=2783665 RepID=UPI00188FE7C3|nr:hypothetical protein [Nocardia sp. BSTN01]MBF4998545.1 hypothetical protein [Nocardia sp. BSTN01]